MSYETVKCNLCGGEQTEVVYPSIPESKEDNPQRYSASSNVIANEQIVRCLSCGLIYVSPRLTREAVVKGYSDAVDETYVSEGEGRLRTFRKGLELVRQYAPKGRILDVGAAAGFFLKAAKDAGWETHGVEPSRWMCDYGNTHFGVNVKPGTLEEARYPDGYFDVVTMWDVLEHTPDPKATLREAHRILKEGGILLTNFPNIGSMLARLAGRKWWFILSVHLYYFTPATLKRMLRESGFEPLAVKPHFQTLSFGYLVFRLKPYNEFLYRLMHCAAKAFRMEEVQIPYYAAQTNIISRKGGAAGGARTVR